MGFFNCNKSHSKKSPSAWGGSNSSLSSISSTKPKAYIKDPCSHIKYPIANRSSSRSTRASPVININNPRQVALNVLPPISGAYTELDHSTPIYHGDHLYDHEPAPVAPLRSPSPAAILRSRHGMGISSNYEFRERSLKTRRDTPILYDIETLKARLDDSAPPTPPKNPEREVITQKIKDLTDDMSKLRVRLDDRDRSEQLNKARAEAAKQAEERVKKELQQQYEADRERDYQAEERARSRLVLENESRRRERQRRNHYSDWEGDSEDSAAAPVGASSHRARRAPRREAQRERVVTHVHTVDIPALNGLTKSLGNLGDGGGPELPVVGGGGGYAPYGGGLAGLAPPVGSVEVYYLNDRDGVGGRNLGFTRSVQDKGGLSDLERKGMWWEEREMREWEERRMESESGREGRRAREREPRHCPCVGGSGLH